jgi:predicted RNA-binding protein
MVNTMCESNAYLIKEGREELVMESVGFVKPSGNAVILRSIFGEELSVDGRLLEINLTGHRIVMEGA